MAEDTEVLRGIWQGGICICVQLSADEIFIPETPVPFFTIAPRLSYLPFLLTDRIHKHFQHYLDPDANLEDVWLEDSNGNPVKWHLPIGVIFDLESFSEVEVKSIRMLTVHYKNFPSLEIARLSSREAMESIIMSGVKEADFLKHKSSVHNNMNKNDTKKLLQGLVSEKFDLFWSVNKRFMEAPKNGQSFRYIPFRIYDCSGNVIQKLLTPTDESGRENTLLDLFQLTLPSLIEEESDETKTSNSYSESVEGESSTTKDHCDTTPSHKKLKFRYLIHGISPPVDTPLQWLSEHMSHPDNFLHICIHTESS